MSPSANAHLAPALLVALAVALPATAQTPMSAVPEEIGSWRLSCAADRMTDRAECLLRHREPVERATGTGSSLVLEVAERGGRLVPMVAARDLTLENASRGVLAVTGTAQLRFPPNRLFEMPCGLEGRALVCAPRAEDAARAAAELAEATLVLVRMAGLGSGGTGEPVELRLERTRDALARYRARVPEGSAPEPAAGSGLSLPQILNRLQQLFGN
jgi:hypothetical protein